VSIVHDFAAAFNRQDVRGLLACFTDGATYVDNFYGPHSGVAALREMFERIFREGRDYHWSMDVVVGDGQHAAAEWTFGYTVSEAVPRSAGRKIAFRGMSVFELDEGKIARYREYFDTGVALLQLGFAPESMVKVLARRA
jgi:limonene-1,2-epoxide hydrolase